MLSFDSISAVGANAAVIHYSIDREEDVALEKSKIYLLDAGAQYDDCTTDITRTLHFGQPTYKERVCLDLFVYYNNTNLIKIFIQVRLYSSIARLNRTRQCCLPA